MPFTPGMLKAQSPVHFAACGSHSTALPHNMLHCCSSPPFTQRTVSNVLPLCLQFSTYIESGPLGTPRKLHEYRAAQSEYSYRWKAKLSRLAASRGPPPVVRGVVKAEVTLLVSPPLGELPSERA